MRRFVKLLGLFCYEFTEWKGQKEDMGEAAFQMKMGSMHRMHQKFQTVIPIPSSSQASFDGESCRQIGQKMWKRIRQRMHKTLVNLTSHRQG